MECSQDILAKDPEGTVNIVYCKDGMFKKVKRFHHGIFQPKHEGSKGLDAGKVLVDINEDSLMINNDNYVYSDTHYYGMLLHLRRGYSKKIQGLVLIHQMPM